MKAFACIALVLTLGSGLAAQQAAPEWKPPAATPDAIRPQDSPYKQESVEFTLAPGEGMEYKYRLGKGRAFLYSWVTSHPVHFEMHSVPDGAPSTFAETFEKLDDRPEAHGSYTAPFDGIHGWYWQNRTDQPVTLKMTTAGFYSHAQEFRRGQSPKVKEF